MTIQYEGSFIRALFQWRGSIWKAVWKELLLWLFLYYGLKVALKYAIEPGSEEFYGTRNVTALFNEYTQKIPLEFLLGFYVAMVVTRWWSQTMALSMPSDLMAAIVGYIPDTDDESNRIRRSCARHIILSFVLAYKNISSRLQKHFPTLDKLIDAGLLTKEEMDVMKRAYPDTLYEIPFQWLQENVRVKVGTQYSILSCLNKHRGHFAELSKFNAYSVPLVYTQTVTIAVYGYFAFCLIGHQGYGAQVDTWVPYLTILRFIFGIGWLKVAEEIRKPFGEDEHDTNLCAVLQKYTRMIYTIAEFVPMNRPGQIMADGSYVSGKEEEETKILAILDEGTPSTKTEIKKTTESKKSTGSVILP